MQHYHCTHVLIIFNCLLEPILADLKSCSEKHDKLELCFKGKKQYIEPIPVNVTSVLSMKEIIEINEERNSISVQLYMFIGWYDGSLSLPNTTEL